MKSYILLGDGSHIIIVFNKLQFVEETGMNIKARFAP